jgi:hypothetical protein
MTVPTTTLRGGRDAELTADAGTAASAGIAPAVFRKDLRFIASYRYRTH